MNAQWSDSWGATMETRISGYSFMKKSVTGKLTKHLPLEELVSWGWSGSQSIEGCWQ